MPLLTVNVGSSSVRLVGYDAGERPVISQHLELAGSQDAHTRSISRLCGSCLRVPNCNRSRQWCTGWCMVGKS